MRLKFVDLNDQLVSKVRELGIEAHQGDIFQYEGVIVSASNPRFTFGGGLDKLISLHFPDECALVDRGKGNQRIGNVIFTITVGRDYRASPELVEEAIRFAIDNTKEGETLLLSGLGTGIGGMSEKDFIKILSNINRNNHQNTTGVR
jgi:hypothetical protein